MKPKLISVEKVLKLMNIVIVIMLTLTLSASIFLLVLINKSHDRMEVQLDNCYEIVEEINREWKSEKCIFNFIFGNNDVKFLGFFDIKGTSLF